MRSFVKSIGPRARAGWFLPLLLLALPNCALQVGGLTNPDAFDGGPQPESSAIMCDIPKAPDPGSSHAPYRVYNIGNQQPVPLMTFIETLEKALGRQAAKNFLPMQAGDVPATYANIDDLRKDVGFDPKTSLDEGLARWTAWFHDYAGRA